MNAIVFVNKIKFYFKTLYEKGLFHILSGSFLTKIVGFLGSVFLVRVLNKQEYGILGYLENMYNYVFVIAGLGLSNAIVRFVILGKDIHEKFSFFRYSVVVGFIWNIILIVLAGIMFLFYPHPEAYKKYVWLLFLLLSVIPFQYLTDNTLSNEQAMFANQRYATLAVFLSATVIISKIITGYFGGIRAVIFAQVIAYLSLGISFIYVTKKQYYSNAEARRLSLVERRQVLNFSIQYMITNSLWSFFMLNDTFLLGRFCTPDIIADYRVAYTIPGSVSIISSSFGIYIAPHFVKHENDTRWIQENFKRIYSIIALLVGGLCILIALMSKPIISFLYGTEYSNVVGVMRILLLATFFNCGLRFTTANIFAAMGKVKYNMAVSGLGIIVQLAINLQVIPHYGAAGAAITSCIVYGIMAIILLAIFLKQYYLKD